MREISWALNFLLVCCLSALIVIDTLNKKPKIIREFPKKDIALVKIDSWVYTCQELKKTSCGYSLRCGRDKFICQKDIELQWL